MEKFGIGVLVVILLAGLFLLSGFVFMLLANVVLAYYGIQTLTYGVALAATAILWLFGGASRVTK